MVIANPALHFKLIKLYSTIMQIQILDRGRRTYDPKKGLIYLLLNFLCLLRDNKAMDLRDKVYALLGLPGPPLKTKTETTATTTTSHNESLGYDPEVLIVDYDTLVQAIVLAT